MRTIRNPKIEVYPDRGKHCFIGRIGNNVYRIFDVIDADELTEEWMKNFHWGDYPSENKPYHGWSGLKEATIIQNICWFHGLAPRVYEIVGIETEGKKYFAQRVEDISHLPFVEEHKDAELTYEKVKELGKIYGFHTEKDDVSNRDVMGDKLVDFNTFHFTEYHREKVMAMVRDKGHYGKSVYQSEPRLDIVHAPRDTEHRIGAMRLNELDFEGKSFLDLGSATGGFCRYAASRGAERILGIDFEDVKGTDTRLAAYLVSWELGYFDIDFEQHDLRAYKPKPAQIVFFLSMAFHINIPDWLGKVTKEVLIFEENSRNFKKDPQVTKDTKAKLESMFNKVELIGYSKDREPQPIFRCWK